MTVPNPHSLRIDNGRIILDATIHGFQDAMCCPTFEVKQTFGLTKGGLMLQNFVSKTPSGTERRIAIESPAKAFPVIAIRVMYLTRAIGPLLYTQPAKNLLKWLVGRLIPPGPSRERNRNGFSLMIGEVSDGHRCAPNSEPPRGIT